LDNQNVVRILGVGNKKPALQKEALAVFSTAARNLIHLELEWILCTKKPTSRLLKIGTTGPSDQRSLDI